MQRVTIAQLLILVLAAVTFAYSANSRTARFVGFDPASAVVLPASVQVFLYGGDRYLAADIESIRSVISAGSQRPDEATFRLRAHQVVADLNPCHEDNYWIGNAELTWGGSQDQGLSLLRRAKDCRFWDQWPAFFYGFNLQFFYHDIDGASHALEQAAQRTDEKNAAAFRKFAIMLQAGKFSDAKVALDLVQRERDRTADPRLRGLLTQRVERLSGLVLLRDAQRSFEARYMRPLTDPAELISTGMLREYPKDPLGIGYTFERGEFQLKRLLNPELERLR